MTESMYPITTQQTFTLSNPNNNPVVANILDCIGTEVIAVTTQYSNDPVDIYTEYELINQKVKIGIFERDATTTVRGAYMEHDELVLVTCFHDGGDYYYDASNLSQNDGIRLVQ